MDGAVAIILISVAFSLFLWLQSRRPENFPPGPWKFPVIGSRYFFPVWMSVRDMSTELAKTFGDVSGLYAGLGFPCIFVSGLEAIKEGLSREDLSGRPENKYYKHKYGTTLGIAFSSGDSWRMQRRFTLHHLRNLGFGKRSLEGIAHEELQAVFDTIDQRSGGCNEGYPVDIWDATAGATGSILWQIVAGKKIDPTNPEMKKIIMASDDLVASNSRMMSGFLSRLTKTFPRLAAHFNLKSKGKPMAKFLREAIASHKGNFDFDNPRDFMEVYLCEIQKQGEGLTDKFNERQLLHVCADLFGAESGTTLRALSFALLYMILYPEVQKRVQEELDEVVGKDRLPSLSDRTRLPYTEATINEVLRISCVTPTTLPHSPLTDEEYVKFRGYHIPKGAAVVFNIYGLHHDPNLWESPEEFKPERFLPENENGIVPGSFIPFGAGKRKCLGETLARNNIFIFFAGILQRYSLRVVDELHKPSTKGYGMNSLRPAPFKVKFQSRC
ncbi:methyl farnesoate epoxidase-like [Ischnura elegans]|uniref:methyl farnesoate epoxidase-like n=1 Tax=Ischnura elegans TaxID=197161 RepID=UPI001ED8B725|nr:methyl farnesoate epoxidase-like [Ischnura elegans]